MSAIPARRQQVDRGPDLRVVAYKGPRPWEVVLARSTLFAVVALGTFLCSCLLGHVLMEKERREGLRARDRAVEARKAETLLRQRVEALKSPATIREWAFANGFRAPEEVPRPSLERNLVAQNR
jgi:hypothetical protein